ncbi:MAG: phosphate transport system regulatory protein PhoU [Solidesulfovibrio magneticus str. Maddingley MBC34]|uniref:Phosphate-specific transport system accessory protein PhoU n=1 Tax=Solidesulfovibrio magneticus str. Maddingley MBC34 TaxID=1206767 RepID=K6GTS5_9BACT|nr:MAG: phosphate transport system regulatory protein PhoU [Solidesulfovibrio magneticus str. Maddingley MBC34]
METPLDQAIHKLKVDVLHMMHLAQDAVRKAVASLLDHNAALAREVIDADREINDFECRVDSESLKILALHHPVAKDLRFIVGSMRMLVNIERLGDEAVNIAERVLVLTSETRLPVHGNLRQLADLALELMAASIACYMDLDDAAALRVIEQNAAALELNVRIFRDVTTEMIKESRPVERAVQQSFVAHSLKRVCDQCANIAESTIFIRRAVDYKHKCTPLPGTEK